MCQKGKMSDEVKDRFKESIKWLVREKKVNCAFNCDCGFIRNFQSIARNVTKFPIFMSSVCQLPAVTCGYAVKEQIIITTAKGRSLEPTRNLIQEEFGVDPEETRYNYIVRCEDVPHFGQAVANGDKVNVEETTPWIVRCCSCTFEIPQKQSISAGMHRASSIFGCHSVLHRFTSL